MKHIVQSYYNTNGYRTVKAGLQSSRFLWSHIFAQCVIGTFKDFLELFEKHTRNNTITYKCFKLDLWNFDIVNRPLK